MTYLPQKQINGSSPKTVVLREEFVALTHDPLVAIVLNQFLYWTQRVKDFDLHLREEQFFNPECNVAPRHGWIYKTATDLIEETMICVDRTTMRRYLKFLMDKGWLEERTHPKNKWDKTIQYRLNLRKLQEDLFPFGFEVPGIELFLQKEFIRKTDDEGAEVALLSDVTETTETSNGDFAPSKEQNALSKGQNIYEVTKNQGNSKGKIAPSMGDNAPSNGQYALSKGKEAPSNVTNSPLYIQRLQTENTNIDHTHRTRARESFSALEKKLLGEPVAEEMVRLWELHVGQEILQMTEERKDQLESLFAFYFQNDMRLWEQFCIRVKSSHFLMGGGPNGWKVSLNWILKGGHVLKVLEGNYDRAVSSGAQESQDFSYLNHMKPNPVRDAEKAAIISSIKDPVWKNWCTRLAEGVRLNELQMLEAPLSSGELSDIANARFLECEDERLLWVGSEDPTVLNKIDNLCHKIKWVFAKEYPKARNFRTRLLEKNSPLEQEGIHSRPLLPNPAPQQGDSHHAQ